MIFMTMLRGRLLEVRSTDKLCLGRSVLARDLAERPTLRILDGKFDLCAGKP